MCLTSNPSLRAERLLAFAKSLQTASTLHELLQLTKIEARDALGYQHAWFLVADQEQPEELRVIEITGDQGDRLRESLPSVIVKGDALVEAVISGDCPIVVPDARLDPRPDRTIVERLGNRTLINLPLRLLDKPLGVLGIGTFGDEGCRVPTDEQLDYLVGMASQLVVAAGRIQFLEAKDRADRERRELERRLYQVQKLESLGMLAGGIAHDFNNLLTVITAASSFAEELTQQPEVREELRSVLGAAQRASDLTRQLLAMSRSQELQLRDLELNDQLRQLIQMTRRILPETIQVELVEGKRAPQVRGDSSQLDQVFMNLFINARDAMPRGGQLRVETEGVVLNGDYAMTHPWASPGRYALITITDTGVGMPPSVSERIFEPFFTTKGPRAGTGLGLAVAYGIVRQHGGLFHCYSEVGVGTSFRIYLPSSDPTERAGVQLQDSPPPGGDEPILIAEDDPAVRAAAIKILERAGYQVTAVHHGEAACEVAAKGQFRLLLLDMVMPGMPSSEVIEHFQRHHGETKILLSSGYTAGTAMAALSEATRIPLLAKPYDPERLLRVVRSMLDGTCGDHGVTPDPLGNPGDAGNTDHAPTA